jgi:prevent-host-death family protein
MSREVGAYEAKTRLPELLRDVERGERITITVRGRPVAELGPARRGLGRPADAVAAMQAFEPIKDVDPATIAEWIEDGRQ